MIRAWTFAQATGKQDRGYLGMTGESGRTSQRKMITPELELEVQIYVYRGRGVKQHIELMEY